MSADTSIDTRPRLSAQNITVRFGGLVAVDDVSIEIGAGSITGLIGPNGAGKSTLFSVLSGLQRPTKGTVHIEGADVTDLSPQRRAALGMARTFQHPELFGELTVREHVTLAHRVATSPARAWRDAFTFAGFRRPSHEELERVSEIIDALRLTVMQDRPVTGLPLGQMRLVEIARSIAREPRLLLLDEASSGLDAEETAELAAILRTLVHDRDVSLLMVEHDVELVLGLADHVYVLDFGRLIASGPPGQIRHDPVVKVAYLGETSDTLPQETPS